MDHQDKECVVVSGVGGHYPECNNVEEFGDALMNGTDVITDSYERWKPGRLGLVGQTGKVSGIDKFDAVFFGMHRKLTDATDPLSRVLMERVFEAIVDAGINPTRLRGSRTAVFMGTALSESENIFIQTTAEDGFGIMGHNRSMMANRVSYYFDFKGPSFALDTSFCSGLSALELGKRAIDTGECDYAIVGTATLSFHPEVTQHFHDLTMACPDGVTKPFHKDANGWVRSESAICMLLQRRSTARRVYASVEHVKVKKFSKDHRAPLLDLDARHMSQHLTEFYQELENMSGITPDDIDYLEAEGAGWKHYDEIEVAAVDEVLCARRTRPLLMGSTMGQMGHAESSSALVALSKVLVAMERGVIPATVHVDQESINPALRAVKEGRLQLVTEHTPHRGALFAINNFGLANLFAHAVLRANPKTKAPAMHQAMEVLNVGGAGSNADGGLLLLKPVPKMVLVSARNEDRMAGVLERLHALAEDDAEYAALLHEVYSMHIYGHLQRAYTFIPHGEGDAALPHEQAPAHGARRPVWFVFSGMGSQWPGMARQLLRVPVFRRAVQRCHDALRPHGVNLLHIITTEDPNIFDNILHSFVGIAAVQVGLTDVLTAIGIKPDGIIGHSVGELGCAYADGCFTAEQMVLAAHARGRASVETVLIQGTMAAVGLGYEEVKDMLPPTIEVACHNSKTSSTISGPAEDMQRFVAQLKDKEVFAKAVNVSNIAYHSRYIAPAGPKLLSLLQAVVPEPKPRSERWVSTSVLEERWAEPLAQTSSAEYHTNNLLSPVFFEEGSRKIPKDAIAIEIAPHGLLQAILRRSLDQGVTNVPLTRRDAPDGALFLMEAIGKLYLAGLNPLVQNLYDPVDFPVSRGTAPLSPLVAWDHTESWYTGRYSQQDNFVPGEKHTPVRALDADYAPYRDYVWQGRVILTPGVVLEKVVEAIHRIHDEEVPVVLEDVHFYEIMDMPLVEEAMVYVMYQRGSGHFEVSVDLHVMARGRAYTPWDGAKGVRKLWGRQPAGQDEGHVLSSQDDVYDELWRRGVGVGGKLRAIRTLATSPSDVQGRVANLDNAMLQLDALLQVYTLLDSEACAELRVPHRIQRVILDSDRTLLHEDGPPEEEQEQQEQQEQQGAKKVKKEIDRPLLGELVFRLHRPSGTLRCANIEIVGVSTRPFPAQDDRHRLAVDLEKFVVHGDQPGDMQSSEALVSAAVQLASQQVALQPLARQSTETVVGVLEGTSSALEQQLRGLAQRSGGVLVRRLGLQEAEQEAAHCDLLVRAGPVGPAGALLAPHALLLAELPAGQQVAAVPEAAILLQHVQGARHLVLYKRTLPLQQAHKVVEVENSAQVAGLRVAGAGVTFVVWRSLPERGIPALLRDVVRTLPGAHRVRSVFLLDPTAPRFSPTHPFYAAQVRLGLAVNVLQNGAWGNLYLQPRPAAAAGRAPGAKELVLNRLSNVQNLSIEYLGLNGDVMEPTNLEVRDGHILDIAWPVAGQQPRGAGLLDYAGRGAGGAVMGVMDAETMTVDPLLQWAVPAGWSLEDAATAPYAYAMAYMALEHTARLLRGERVLVHDGWSAIGQAALDVALAIGADVYTTYRVPEERDLILRRFPGLAPDHVMDLQREKFELKLSMEWRTEDRQRRGYRVLLSTLSGEGLWASLRRMSLYARVVQINGPDVANGTRMGLSLFIKSTSFYGVDPTCLVHLPDHVRRCVHDMVQAGLDAGVVRPLDRTVLPASHAMQALSYLDGDCTDKVILEMGPSKTVVPTGGFHCDQKASYIVVGGCRSEALHTVDWLLSRGARCVLLAGLQDAALSQVTLRRLALMRARWGAHVTTVPGVRADTPQGAATLVGRAANMAPLHTVLVLPSVSSRQDEVVQALDGVLRGPGRESVLLVAVETSSPSGRLVQACAARRRAAGRAALVALDVAAPHLRVLALDSALADPQPVLHVGLVHGGGTQATHQERLCELLPQSQAALVGLANATTPTTWSATLTSSFGGSNAKSYEMHPVFLVAGLGDSPAAQMQPLARLLMANAVLLVPGAEHDEVPAMAAALVEAMRAQQPGGPYTLVARGWGGCLGLEVARQLEERGERVALVLMDCAPQDLQASVQGLEQARGQAHAQDRAQDRGHTASAAPLQAWLLCTLLHLEPAHYDVLEALPSWPARLDRALDVALDGSPQRAVVAKALDLVCRRLRALAGYSADLQLKKTVVTLLRPAGSEPDDFRGLDALHVTVHVVEPPLGTDAYWTEAARIVSQDAYVGLKPMYQGVMGKTTTHETLWQRLR